MKIDKNAKTQPPAAVPTAQNQCVHTHVQLYHYYRLYPGIIDLPPVLRGFIASTGSRSTTLLVLVDLVDLDLQLESIERAKTVQDRRRHEQRTGDVTIAGSLAAMRPQMLGGRWRQSCGAAGDAADDGQVTANWG